MTPRAGQSATVMGLAAATIGARERAVRGRVVRRLLALLLLATLLSIVHVWSRVQVLELRYSIQAVQQRIEQLAKEMGRWESVVASLESADRLTKVASEQLGLAMPSTGQTVVVRARSIIGAP